jgi:hypothetical protein
LYSLFLEGKAVLLELCDLACEGTTVLVTVSNYLPSDIVSYPRRQQSSIVVVAFIAFDDRGTEVRVRHF